MRKEERLSRKRKQEEGGKTRGGREVRRTTEDRIIEKSWRKRKERGRGGRERL